MLVVRWDKGACWRAASKAMKKTIDACRLVAELQPSIETLHRPLRICAGDAQMPPATPRTAILTKDHSLSETESGDS